MVGLPAFQISALFRFTSLMVTAVLALANGAELKTDTKTAWQVFVGTANSRVEQEAQDPDTFLAVDRSPELRAKVRAGEISVYPVTRRGSTSVRSGLIHDWIGHVFIPDVTGNQVIEKARRFGQYPIFYKPSVLNAQTVQNRNGCAFSMLLRQRVLFIDAAIQGQYECSYYRLPPNRWYSVTISTRLQEILNYAHPNERLFDPDTGDGFIWRLHNVAKYEEADGGVYMEVEAIALSRPIPPTLRWMINGIVEGISRSALTTSLRQTRQANAQ